MLLLPICVCCLNGVFNIGARGQQILHMAQSFVWGKKDFLVLYVIFFEERGAWFVIIYSCLFKSFLYLPRKQTNLSSLHVTWWPLLLKLLLKSRKKQALLITVSTKGTFGGLPFNPGSQQDTNSHKSINKATLWSLCVYNQENGCIYSLKSLSSYTVYHNILLTFKT